MKIYRVTVFCKLWEYWYNDSNRVWYYAQCDDEGNIGPTYNSHSKEYALIGIGIAAASD